MSWAMDPPRRRARAHPGIARVGSDVPQVGEFWCTCPPATPWAATWPPSATTRWWPPGPATTSPPWPTSARWPRDPGHSPAEHHQVIADIRDRLMAAGCPPSRADRAPQPRLRASSGPAPGPARDQPGTSSGTSSGPAREPGTSSGGPAWGQPGTSLGPAWDQPGDQPLGPAGASLSSGGPALGPAWGPAWGQLWGQPGPAPGTSSSLGPALGQPGTSLGPAWGQLWDQPGTSLGTSSGTSLGPAWGQPGTSQLGPAWDQPGPAWDQPGTSPGPAWGQPGTSLGPAWGQPGASLGPAWDQLRDQPGTSLGPAWGQPPGTSSGPAWDQPGASSGTSLASLGPALGPAWGQPRLLTGSAGWWWPHERGIPCHPHRPGPPSSVRDGQGRRRTPMARPCALGRRVRPACGNRHRVPSVPWTWDPSRVPSLRERNTEIRRCGIERHGWDRFIHAAGLTQVDEARMIPTPATSFALYDVPKLRRPADSTPRR